MYNALLFAGVLMVAFTCYASYRHFKKIINELREMIASNYACVDYLKEEADATHEALQHLINRHELHISMTKFNLAASRLQFILHQQIAIKNEKFEDAANIANAISQINRLLEIE